jgi:hypothetical protein
MADAWHFLVEALSTSPRALLCTRLIRADASGRMLLRDGRHRAFFLLVFTDSKSGKSRAIYIFNDRIAFSQC